MFDGGHWTFHVNEDADSFVERYYIEGCYSDPDARLYINGNFGSDEAAKVYGESLCAVLNKEVPDFTDTKAHCIDHKGERRFFYECADVERKLGIKTDG